RAFQLIFLAFGSWRSQSRRSPSPFGNGVVLGRLVGRDDGVRKDCPIMQENTERWRVGVQGENVTRWPIASSGSGDSKRGSLTASRGRCPHAPGKHTRWPIA